MSYSFDTYALFENHIILQQQSNSCCYYKRNKIILDKNSIYSISSHINFDIKLTFYFLIIIELLYGAEKFSNNNAPEHKEELLTVIYSVLLPILFYQVYKFYQALKGRTIISTGQQTYSAVLSRQKFHHIARWFSNETVDLSHQIDNLQLEQLV